MGRFTLIFFCISLTIMALSCLIIWVMTKVRWRRLQENSSVVRCRAKLVLIYRYRGQKRAVFQMVDGQRICIAIPDQAIGIYDGMSLEGEEGALTYKGDAMYSFRMLDAAAEGENVS